MKLIFLYLSLLGILFAQVNYESNNVERRGGKFYKTNTQQLVNGVVLSRYKDNSIEQSLMIKDGVPNGLTREYYPSGNLQFEYTHKNGKINGLYRKFYKNGNIQFRMILKDDILDGLIHVYKEDGTFDKNMSYEEFENQ